MKIVVETNRSPQLPSAVSFGQTIDQMSKKPRRPTITDMASHLEVHPSTISLALRNSSKVSPPVRQRIHNLASEWGYVPNQTARSLRSKRTKLIGLVFPYAAIPHYGTLLDRLCRRIEKLGYRSEVLFHEWSIERERTALRTLIEQQVEGVLINSAGNPATMMQEVLPPNLRLPAVMFGRPPQIIGWNTLRGCVATNALTGARILARHLLDRGHRYAALLIGDIPRGRSTTAMRVAGLRNEYRRHENTYLHTITLADEARPDGGREIVRQQGSTAGDSIKISKALVDQLLSLKPLPTAVVTADEITAHILLSMLAARGLSVPRDISIACFGGTLFAAYGAVPLTAVEHPYDNLSEVALDLLLQPPKTLQPQVRLLPPTFVDRGSVQTISRPVNKAVSGRALSRLRQDPNQPDPTPP